MHIHNTTPKKSSNCNKNECSEEFEYTQNTNMIFGHVKKAYEKIEKGRNGTSFPSKNNIASNQTRTFN